MAVQDRAASSVNVTGTDRKIDTPETQPDSLDVHGWQPIETAPPDKEVLGFQSTRGDHEDRMGVCWAIITTNGHFWVGSGGLTPTHWMPLPYPPVLP